MQEKYCKLDAEAFADTVSEVICHSVEQSCSKELLRSKIGHIFNG